MEFVPWSVARVRVAQKEPVETGWKIYGLVDPRTLRLMYIGQTKRSLDARLITHILKPVSAKTRQWIASLAIAGMQPQIHRLADTTEETWERDEMRWIAWARSFGRLLNTDPGGNYRGPGAVVRPEKRRMAKKVRRGIRRLLDDSLPEV